MRPVKRGLVPNDPSGNPTSFSHYRDARDPLIERIGDCCSYCETALHSSIDVEHVQPKKHYAAGLLAWDNFLLACDECNKIKSAKPVVLNDYLWPDQDNTFRAFVYELDDAPKPADGLDPINQTAATQTIQLTGLDRVPGHPRFSGRDRRWLKRREAWGVALLTLREYRDGRVSPLSIGLTAVSRGFFSIWMTVFADFPEVRSMLIGQFKASADCFDASTQPVHRPGGRI